MKITKLHIFLILLIALVVCSCLGICSSSTKEGYTSSTYDNYGKYYSDLNDENISATDWSQGLDDKDDKFNKKYDRRYDDRNSYRKGSYSYKDDLNGGDKNDSSTYMISTSFKKNKKYDDYNNNDDNNNPRRRNDIFSSVSNGAVNGSLFSNFNNNNNSDNNNNNNGVTRDQIPDGQEDLYILKSQALTPICPACPAHPKIDCDKKCNSKSKCPPCPPCARCPEPQFDCVKVPNYNTTGLNQNLPIPWMAKL